MNPIPMNEAGTDLGSIQIAPEVLEIIAAMAVAEVEGVASTGGSLADGFAEMIGRKNPTRGVRVTLAENRAKVELSVVILYGYRIPDVCDQIGRTVKHAIQTMTGVEVSEVHIQIHGVQFKDKPAEQDAQATGRVR